MKKVLFICTGNSCRSQMAEGLLRHLAGDRYEVFSAGLQPSFVHPLAIMVMKEIGIDISHHRSEPLDRYLDETFDYVITVCSDAERNCPVFPGNTLRMHWPIPDPARAVGMEEEIMDTFRSVRDKLRKMIEEFADI